MSYAVILDMYKRKLIREPPWRHDFTESSSPGDT